MGSDGAIGSTYNVINAHKAVLRTRGLDVGFPRKASVTRGHWSPEQTDAFLSALNKLSFAVE